MISTTRRWLRRNRTNFAIGLGVLGAGYVAGQYIINKISEARERMSIDRIAREKYARLLLFLDISLADVIQLAASISAKSRRLYLYSPRSTTYGRGKHTGGTTCGKHYT